MNAFEKVVICTGLVLIAAIVTLVIATSGKKQDSKKRQTPPPQEAQIKEKSSPDPIPTEFPTPEPIPTISKETLGKNGDQLWLGLYKDDPGANFNNILFTRISVQADLPLEKQVAHLSQAVSRHLFRNQTITAKVLKNKKGESIAHVDLANLDDSWYQGSSGGGDTQNRLVNSYLQKDLDEAWIDGLRFFIDGSPFGYGDHINLNYEFRRHGKHIELKQQ